MEARVLASLRPGEPPLDELTYEDQNWLVNAFSALQQIYEKRETGTPADNAFCIFKVESIYVQFLAPWDANQLVCEAVSTRSIPEIAVILGTEGDAALKKLGFEAPEVSPNYLQLIPIEGVADLAYAARLLYRTLKHVYQIANITDVKYRIKLPHPPSIDVQRGKVFQKLENMPLADRIAAVAADVDSERDEFRSIDAHELASLLGIEQAEMPDSYNWSFSWYVKRKRVDSILDDWDDIVELLQSQLTPERYKELCSKIDLRDNTNYAKVNAKVLEFLTVDEEAEN